ncbi:MAG: diaminopimelate epimerase [Balneolales bacterium]|nr:diaminopimelate epimerase [Balneolales bacterium]
MKKTELKFTKMQGAGNDFVVFDNRPYGFLLDEIIAITPRLCHRRFGVGADGVLVLEPSAKADYRMIYRNADGSDAGMCGNGARCLARFANRAGFGKELSFMVHDKEYRASISNEEVSVFFPVEPAAAEFISLLDRPSVFVDSGTEHVVTWVKADVLSDESKLRDEGRTIRYMQDLFPTGTNVNFVTEAAKNHLVIKTYERGVEDLTLACGTGALACSIGQHMKQTKGQAGTFSFDIDCSGGRLKTSFTFDSNHSKYFNLRLTGPADFVFDGSYFIDKN